MKTKYIIHGGAAQHQNGQNDSFFAEILKSAPQKVNVLLVHFAGEVERAKINEEIDTQHFERVKGDKLITYTIAREDSFLRQIKNAHVIYFGGGTTVKLMVALKKFKNLAHHFEGKIVAGESAGANVLVTYCYSKSGGGVMACLGILPIKFRPHYGGEDNSELESVAPNLETVSLSNYKYRVFEVT